MDERDARAAEFEAQRATLRAIAHRMLGSATEADDAVQEAWLRLERTGADRVENLPGWLRTVVTRICLDLLRARRSRREELVGSGLAELTPAELADTDPEGAAVLADSVSQALLVVLEALTPHERVAFVLHDMFAVPFHQIAPIVERTPVATKKLASRARQKVQGTPAIPTAELAGQRRVVGAFLAAARTGDLAGVLAVLAPDVVRRADPAILPPGVPAEVRGARAVAEGTVALADRARQAELALVNGTVGAILAADGRLRLALTFTIENQQIQGYEVIADPTRLRGLDFAILD